MSLYSELLELVLHGNPDDGARPVAALVSDALRCRAQLTPSGPGQASGRPARAADRVADSLAYDAALVRLCDRLALEHELTIDGDVRAARWRAEARLVGRLPTLAAALGVAEQTDVQ